MLQTPIRLLNIVCQFGSRFRARGRIESTDLPITNSQIFGIFVYWVLWIVIGAAMLQFTAENLFHAWWMILGVFWLSVPCVRPIYLLPGHLRPFGIAVANVVAAMLICWTYYWFIEILDGWSLSESIGWLRTESMALRAVAASVLTSVVLLRPIQQLIGRYTVPFLFIAALWTGLITFAPALISANHWRQHWLASCLELFETLVLPMVMVAMAQRECLTSSTAGTLTRSVGWLLSGDVRLRTIFVVVYPLTVGSALCLQASERLLSRDAYTSWKYYNLWAGERLLTIAVLLFGSVITWRALGRAARDGIRYARCLQAAVLIVAAMFVLNTVYHDGFAIGAIITDSTSAALGGNYTLLVDEQDDEIRFSGLITYGLPERLRQVLAAHPGVRRIRLDSPGGYIEQGADAAKIIADHELDTVVRKECLSSCTLMFIAGKTRTLVGGARLGFHDTRDPDPLRQSNHKLRPFLEMYGIAPEFITRIEVEHPVEIWFPTRDELIAGHVLSSPDVTPANPRQ